MDFSRSLQALAIFLILYSCVAGSHSSQTEHADFDSESFNTKWTAIKTWLNSTKLANTNSIISPRIKLLCTNKFIDLIVVMCKQYLSHEIHFDSIIDDMGVDEVSHEDMPRIRHAHHRNLSSLTSTNKKLRSLLRKTLPATAIQTCCSESCNVTSLLKFCPIEPRLQPAYVRSNKVVIGTLTVMHPHNHKHPREGIHSNDTLARLRHNYDVWRARTHKPVHLATSTLAVNHESEQSDESKMNESSNGSNRSAREDQEEDHKSTEPTIPTTTTLRHSFIDRYNHTPEPYTFDLRSTDVLYRP